MPSIVSKKVLVISFVTALCLLGDSALYVLLPAQMDAFAVTPTGAGLILGINRYVRVVTNSAAAWLIERIGIPIPVSFAILMAGITTAAYGLFEGFWPLFIAHALWGVAWSILRLCGYLTVFETAKGPTKGRSMGFLQSGSRAGSLLAVVSGGILADAIGVGEVFLVFGLLTFAGLALVPTFGKSDPLTKHQSSNQEVRHEISGVPKKSTWALYSMAFATWLVMPGMMVGIAAYLVSNKAPNGVEFLGVSLGVGALAGAVVAIRWLGDLFLGPVLGDVSDRVGRTRTVGWCVAGLTGALCLLSFESSISVALLTLPIIFITGLGLQISLSTSVADIAPPALQPRLLGRYTTWADIGSGTGPIIGLPMATALGFGWTFGSAALLIGTAGILYVLVTRAARRIATS